MIETWTFARRDFSIIDNRDVDGTWEVWMDGLLLFTRPADQKPNRLFIHSFAFKLIDG